MNLNIVKVLIVLVLLSLLNSCGDSIKAPEIKEMNSTKIIELPKKLSYSYYLPSDSTNIKAIIIIMDPHGKPNIVMDSMHHIADNNQIALLGLSEIKNGISNHQLIIERDLKDFTTEKNIIQPKIYLLGFSGAARMAVLYAQRNRIDGLMICGAGMRRQSQLPFPTVLMAGMGDFNFMEQFYGPNNPKIFQKSIIALHYRGKHAWPPIEIMNEAIEFILARGTASSDAIAQKFQNKSKEYLEQKEYYLSFKSMEVAYKLSSAEYQETRKNDLIKLSNKYSIKTYFSRLELYMEGEQKRYQMLNASLDVQDLIWWNNQINFMENKTKGKRNLLEADSYSRTMAYLGILMYSRLNAGIAGRGQYALIPKYLEIYQRIEPQNPDLYFFKAVYAYTQSQEADALNFLRKAKDLGFTDDDKIRTFFAQDFVNKLNS